MGNGKLVDVPFTVLPDQIVELDETIGFELSDLSPPIAQGTIASSLHTIMDDDSATISVATTQHADESGPVNGVLTVTMTQEASTDTTVQYIHSSGTAIRQGLSWAIRIRHHTCRFNQRDHRT